ncbi:hypothetical protein AVEN_251389-1 [Araneus ventricosus]|uniref:Uncharacterized protein n=1 Tax=Araneus ventricosus TaxID=182803 RepID=A0A4Y2UN62_ARAVE|nr:hypothetical protein AVEN_251389-1 [Araneus ventricosus]
MVRCVHNKNCPTSWIMENNTLFRNIPENSKPKKQEKIALVQISNSNRYQIINNKGNSMNKRVQYLKADQLAMRTRLQRVSKTFKHIPKTSKVVRSSQQLRVFIVFQTGFDVT